MHIMNLRSPKVVGVAVFCFFCCQCLSNPPSSTVTLQEQLLSNSSAGTVQSEEKVPWMVTWFTSSLRSAGGFLWEKAWNKGIVALWWFLINPDFLHDLRWAAGGCVIGGALGVGSKIGVEASTSSVMTSVIVGCALGGTFGFQAGTRDRLDRENNIRLKDLLTKNKNIAETIQVSKEDNKKLYEELIGYKNSANQLKEDILKISDSFQQEKIKLVQKINEIQAIRGQNETTMNQIKNQLALCGVQQNQ